MYTDNLRRWNGGIPGIRLHGPHCIWPFCSPGGRDHSSKGGSEGDQQDPPDDQSRSPERTPSATSSSCSRTSIVSDCSVFCVSNTASSTQSCTTGCFSTVTGCSITGTTTTTIQSTGTPAFELCSPDCPSCNPDDASKPRISVRKQKRVLPTPSTNGIATFINYQTDHATRVPLVGYVSTALFERLINERLDMAVTGLWGCTSVIVVSKKGVYMSHFWEGDLKDFERAFNPVVRSLLFGNGVRIPRILAFREMFFDPESEPATIIVTPRKSPIVWKRNDGSSPDEIQQPLPGELQYPDTIRKLKAILQIQFKDPVSNPIVPIIVDYIADKNKKTRENNVSGKVLFQYDPVQGMFPELNDDCKLYQEARLRLWMGIGEHPILDKGWLALPDQLVPQNGKRALSESACGLSLSSSASIVTASGRALQPTSKLIPTPTDSSVDDLGMLLSTSKMTQSSTLATIHLTSTITVIPLPLTTAASSVPPQGSWTTTIQSTITVIPLPSTLTTLPRPVPTLNVPEACARIHGTRDFLRHSGAHCVIP